MNWFRKSADQGDAAAQNHLGYMYEHGLGISQDDAQALAWYRKSADQGFAAAENHLGYMYAQGRGVSSAAKPKGFPQVRPPASTPTSTAKPAPDYAQALVWYRKSADQGYAAAQANLGYVYAQGLGVSPDDAQALAWYRKSADQGNANAQASLAHMYAQGLGVSQDYAQAVTWYRKAADQGYALGQNDLGYLYEHDLGVPQDYAQALVLYRKSADQGYATAQYNIGLLYESGAGGSRDLEEARKWFQKAAAQGEQRAQDELAKLDAPTPPRGLAPETPSQAAASAVPIPHNYALIFATDDYAHWPHLTNPVSDADAVNQALTSLYAFHVEEVRNATDEQVLAKLTEYLHRKFEPQDQLLIMFSGHGYFDPDLGKGFLVPANGLLVKDDIGHRTLLAHETIMGYVNRIPAKHVVLVLDACFAGTLDRRIADSGLRGDTSDVYAHATLPELLARKEPKRTRRYITSGGKDFVPDGLPGHHSPFISAFLVTLNQAADRKGYVTLDDIQQGLNTVNPEPRWGDIQDDNDPGADFLLLTPSTVAQLTKPN